MMKAVRTCVTLFAGVAAGLAYAADVEPVYSDGGATATITVPAGVTNDLSVVFATSVTKIVKDGAGTLKLSQNQNTGLTAEWRILGGRVIADLKSYFGANASVYVGPDGTLDSIVESTPRIGMTLAGTLEASRNGGITGKFDPIKLEGDAATINYGGLHWGVYQTGLYMYGHPVTIRGSKPSSSCNVGFRLSGDSGDTKGTIYDPGDIIVDNANLCLHDADVLFKNTTGHDEKPSDASVVLKNGGYLSMTSRSPERAFPMGIHVSQGTGTLVIWNGTQNVGYNQICGPIAFDKGTTFDIWARSGFHSTFSGPMSGSGKLSKRGQGTLWLTGRVDRVSNQLEIERGTVRLQDGAKLLAGNTGSSFIGHTEKTTSNFDGIPRLMVESGCSYAITNGSYATILANGENQHGMLEVRDGAIVTNNLYLGVGGNGYVRQLGGKVCWANATSGFIARDATSYGVYMITNGEMRCGKDQCFSIGLYGTGLYYQRGGNSYPDYSMHLGQKGGQADIYVSAGTFYDKNSAYCGQNVSASTASTTGRATITLDGPTADAFFNFWGLTAAGGNFTTQVNVRNGGVFRPSYIYRNTDPAANPNCHCYLTSDGGVFKRTNSGNWHKNDNEPAHATWLPADKLVVYKGGVTFHSAGSNRWSTAIVAPTGKGIKSITLPKAVLDLKSYPGPAKLTLTSTAGVGATAVCDFEAIESSTAYAEIGRQKGVIVTCPGWDYEDEGGTPSVTCTVSHPSVGAASYEATVELEDNDTTGGLTLEGGGKLVIASTGNTYGGETFVKSGTLIVEATASLPPASPIRMAKNTSLAFRANNVVISNLTTEGAAWISGYGLRISESYTCDAATLDANNYTTIPSGITFDEGAKLIVKNAETLESRLTVIQGYTSIQGASGLKVVDETGKELTDVRVSLSADGQSLRIGPAKGLAVIVR